MMYRLNDFFTHLGHHKQFSFKRESYHNQDFIIVSYMVIVDQKMWDIPLALEARGITFNAETGNIVSLPFHKFFNLNETEYTQEYLFPHDDATLQFLEKRDGSMVTPVKLSDNGDFVLKTKKSIHSEVAKFANQNVTNNVRALIRELLVLNLCPIFEFTSPHNRIVIDYGEKPNFVLLAIRSMETNQYLPRKTEEFYAQQHGVEIIKKFPQTMTLNEAKEFCKNEKDSEGFVITLNDNQNRIKLKTDWYCRLHGMTNLTERSIAELIIDEQLDDIIPIIVESGRSMVPIRKISKSVQEDLDNLIEQTENLIEDARRNNITEPKDFAIQNRDNPVFPLAIRLFRGGEPDYKDFWKRHYLKQHYLPTPVYFGADLA